MLGRTTTPELWSVNRAGCFLYSSTTSRDVFLYFKQEMLPNLRVFSARELVARYSTICHGVVLSAIMRSHDRATPAICDSEDMYGYQALDLPSGIHYMLAVPQH